MLIKLSVTGADLRNRNKAWQFQGLRRPDLALVVRATVQASWRNPDRIAFRETLVYRGHQTVFGNQESFEEEMGRAARYIAGRILMRLMGPEIPAPGISPGAPGHVGSELNSSTGASVEP